jgi:hypothetical protein
VKKPWSYLLVCVVAVVGIASIIATSPPPNYFTIITANNNANDSYYRSGNEQSFACLNEKVTVKWYVSSAVTLNAVPNGQLNPDLTNKKAESSGTFETEVLGAVTVTMTSDEPKREVVLGLLPELVCKGFPINLITDFAGTLQQASPTAAMLNRSLKFRWRENALQAILTTDPIRQEQEDLADTVKAPCQLFPDEDKLICLSGDEVNPRLRLEGIITVEGFTGSYKGFDESTAGTVSFEGTFNFQKMEPQPQPQQPQ